MKTRTKNSTRGGRNGGAAYEQAVIAELAWHKDAAVYKTPDPVKITGRGPRGDLSARLEARSTVDFLGVVRGVAVAFDAKMRTDGRLALSDLEHRAGPGVPTQRELLAASTRAGAFGFVLGAWQDGHRRLEVIVPVCASGEIPGAQGRRSITYSAPCLEQYRRTAGEPITSWILRCAALFDAERRNS